MTTTTTTTTSTASTSRKRRPSSDDLATATTEQEEFISNSNSISALELSNKKKKKRSKLNHDESFSNHDENSQTAQGKKETHVLPLSLSNTRGAFRSSPPPCPSSSSSFFKCHLWMLRSLYASSQYDDDDAANDDDDGHDPTAIKPTDRIWKQIEQYLSCIDSLQSNNSRLIHLSQLVAESKSIAEQPIAAAAAAAAVPLSSHPFSYHPPPPPPPPTLLQRMNTSLKSETKLSFSFVTQSQQSRVTSLSLTSPRATTTTSSTSVMRNIPKSFNQKSISTAPSPFWYRSSLQQSGIKARLTTPKHGGTSTMMSDDVGTRKIITTSSMETKLHSMNLVTSILWKQYKAQMQWTVQQQEPFLPLLDSVQKEIQRIQKEMSEIVLHHSGGRGGGGGGEEEENEGTVYDLRRMSTQDIWKLLTTMTTTTTTTTVHDTSFSSMDKLSMMKCRLGLWRALESSLESVICAVFDNLESL